MRKIGILFFASLLIIVESCTLAGIFDGINTANGEAEKFVTDGFSLPAFAAPEYTPADGAELPVINNTQMFQVGQTYNFTMYVVNPEKLELNYDLTSDSFLMFENEPTAILASGTLNEVKNYIEFPFRLQTTADKNDIQFSLKVESPLRSYETPNIATIHVNTRPSMIVPVRDALGNEIIDGVWSPVISGNQATIYWDHTQWPTDSDISHLEVMYKVGNNPDKATINYNSSTQQFGDNSYTVDNIPAGSTIDFSINVFDSEYLDSGYYSTGNFVPKSSPDPVITRGTGADFNKVTVTAEAGSTLYCRIDDEAFSVQASPHEYQLTGTHTIEAYTVTDGLFDSRTVSLEYSINYMVVYNGNTATSGTEPVDLNGYELNDIAVILGRNSLIKMQDGISMYLDGWTEDANNLGLLITEGSTFTVTGGVILYAKWLTVGGTGPSGGQVFYDAGSVQANGWRYMEVAPADESGGYKVWSNITNISAGTSSTFGEGKNNTYKIVNQTGCNAGAAYLCDNLVIGEFSDWFLPSYYEFNEIYNNLMSTPVNIGNLSDGMSVYYWSSTESSSTVAWRLAMIDPSSWNNSSGGKGEVNSLVRAVRSFRSANPTYSVIYNTNGATMGSVPVDAYHYENGQTVTVKTNSGTLRYNDFNFDGWNTEPDGSGITYPAGTGTFAMGGSDITLYPLWGSPPCRISNIADLNYVRNYLVGSYILTVDINFSNAYWAGYDSFTGVFDGDRHEISNIRYSNTVGNHRGFFYRIGEGGVVKDLGMRGVSTSNSPENAGGLTTYNAGTIERCYVINSTINCAWNDHRVVGGLAGNNTGLIRECFSTATVNGYQHYAGGLVGTNSGTIIDSYSLGYTTSNIGGNPVVAGFIASSSVIAPDEVKNCYSTGYVPAGNGYRAGFIRGGESPIYDCFYDIETSGQPDNGKGVPKLTVEMKTQTTFTNWDFTTIWAINGSINNGYPYLRRNPPPP